MFNPQTTDEKGGGFIQKNLNLAPYYKQYNNEKLRIHDLFLESLAMPAIFFRDYSNGGNENYGVDTST